MSVNCISVDWFLYCPVILQCITTEGNWVKNVGNLCYFLQLHVSQIPQNLKKKFKKHKKLSLVFP